MASLGSTVRVSGLRETQAAFRKLDRELAKELRDGLKAAGEHVREAAEQKAFGEIANIGPRWGRMRLGVRTKSVYIAPATRRSIGSPRPAFGVLLLRRAMFPAVDENEGRTVHEVERVLDHLTREAGF